MSSAFHSAATDSWGTPPEILAAARRVLGGIDLDPCTSKRWNRSVQAVFTFNEREDGLSQQWFGNVWLNPPGGKYPKGHPMGGKSKAGLFWAKLLWEIRDRQVDHAVVCAFSLNQLQSTQGCALGAMLDFPLCFPSSRVKYVAASGKAASPPHASAFVYVPGTLDKRELFAKEFSVFGRVINLEV